MRPKLAGSEAAQSMMAHLLDSRVMMPPIPAVLKPGSWIVSRVLRSPEPFDMAISQLAATAEADA